ncbi:hypothetical protein NP233_g4938 [Leucocoprinus birnbaumii]|uniref:Uncharacterized protein n=1 Tax=Leucocoprinus birnbaumii TaxID=56174 RepID=A0AAD5VTR5_9AGAR|nr:hypothetical protein NP233_g4938 [Leucocoprinus birnbaumii]
MRVSVLRAFKFCTWLIALYCLRYTLVQFSGKLDLEHDLKQQLDFAIAGHTRQILRHLVIHQVAGPKAAIEKIRETQMRLACYINRGVWSVEGRKTMRYRHDSRGCLGRHWPSLEDLDLLQVTSLFCNRMRGKRVLLVGPRAFYHAQTLLLQALATHDNKSYPSRSPESGSHYFICGDSGNAVEPSTVLPFNPRNASSRHPSALNNSTRLLFSLSDVLTPQDRMSPLPIINPKTGIRTYASNWLADSSKYQVLILNKGPMSAPASTYDGHTGNWSFVQAIPQELYHGFQTSNLTLRVINAAFHTVLQEYIPDLLQALKALPPSYKVQRIFTGPWYQQPICTNAGLDSSYRVADLIWANTSLVDPWSLYYNTQVYIIDQILPVILPHFNVIYAPMTMSLAPSTLRSGHLEQPGIRKDCLRLPSSHPVGHALQMGFIKVLVYIIQHH